MEKERIREISKLGEALAAYVKEFDDKRFFSKFYELQRGDYFRSELLRAAKNAASRGKPPLFRYEEFAPYSLNLMGIVYASSGNLRVILSSFVCSSGSTITMIN